MSLAGFTFVAALAVMVALLCACFSPFRAVSLALAVVAVTLLNPATGPGAAAGGVPLVAAAACVGIVIGLVSRTGIGTGVPAAIIPLAATACSWPL